MSDEIWKRVPNWLFGVGLIAVAAVVGIQMLRGDALLCSNGALFAKSCAVPDVPTIPHGLVVASQRRCADLGGGWRTYDAGAGRVIVGAGAETISGFERTFLFEEEGGYWEHTLTEDEMPSHSHAIGRQTDVNARDDKAFLARGSTSSMADGRTSPTGRGLPHNNMPPYIALYLCSRED